MDNDCVIIPGLGGFVAHYVEARYDERDNSYLPPSRTLGFNAKLDMNDSLLAQSYVEAYDISYPEAVARIEAEVDDIRRTLGKEGFYDFSDLGTLMVNPEGNYEFSPCESGILTPALYGLSSFEIEKTASSLAADESIPVVAVAVSPEQEAEPINAPARMPKADFPYGESKLAEEMSSNHDDDGRTISIKVSILRNFLAAACAIVAFFLLASPINNREASNEVVSGFGAGLLYNLVPDNSGAKQRQLMKPSNINKKALSAKKDTAMAGKPDAATEKAEMASGQEVADMASGRYSIVLACRITKTNAEAYVRKLHADGYAEARILEHENEYLKVVYGSYSDESSALRSLKSLRSNPEFEYAWVYKDNK